MIGPRTYTAVGVYTLTNVSPHAPGALVIQTRLVSGTGLTWALRKRMTETTVAAADAPRTAFTDELTATAVTNATAITATTAPQIHAVQCDGCDVILEVLTNSGAGVLQVEMMPITGRT